MDTVTCCFCDQKFTSTYLLNEHFKGSHKFLKLSENVPGRFVCKAPGCEKTFSRSSVFLDHCNKMHMSKKDKSVDKKDSSKKTENITPQSNEGSSNSYKSESLGIDGRVSEMIANLRFSTTMTGADLGRSVDATEDLLSGVMEQVQERVKDFLEKKGIDTSDKEAAELLKNLEFNESFSKYKNMDGQIRALKKHYDYIDPEEKLLDADGDENATFQYISLIETLKLILSNKEVMDYIKGGVKISDDEFIRFFEDGETYREHELFKKFVDAIGIHLYYDEFLVNNPLGSKTRQNKIGALYFSISNLPPHLRDFLGNVHVLAFGLHEDIANHGMNKFLNPLFLELKLLETDNGVKVKINDEDYVLHAALLTVCADTLAAHEVLGFLGPSATHFCRLCYMTSHERKEIPHSIAKFREERLHDKQAGESELNKDAQTASGIRNKTILNGLKYFHCVRNYCFDCMHDILEGQGAYDLKLVIAHLIDTKEYKLTVDILNHRIERFPYGPNEIKDKPSATLTYASIKNVNVDHKLQERSAQTWCLLRIFPFLVADKVPANDPYMQHIINLNRINEYVFAPAFKKSNIGQLNDLVYDHIKSFVKLFPDASIINKLHHLSHYALCMEKSGPMRHLACFKYEAKHQMFKKYGSVCCNFKNICKTMANISQMSQCSVWGTKKGEIRKKLGVSATSEISGEGKSDMKKIALESGIELSENLKLFNKIDVYGIQYRAESIVAIDGSNNGTNLPIFGKIEKIVVSDDKIYLFCKEFHSQYLDGSLNAYCVEEGDNYRFVAVEDLCDRKPFSLWNTFAEDNSLKYICLRHLIF